MNSLYVVVNRFVFCHKKKKETHFESCTIEVTAVLSSDEMLSL